MNYEQLCQRLGKIYDMHEAKAIIRLVLEVRFGLSTADIYCGKVTQLSPNDQADLEKIMQRLEKAEPVQYVLGVSYFCGRQFYVAPGVLIPRPETAELCHLIVKEGGHNFLDIGTGSGCIAITLALDVVDAHVTAWDISNEALSIAKVNARKLQAQVDFKKQDILHQDNPLSVESRWDVIVSNPPYICKKEADEMDKNVLMYEPHTALFVPDDDPLLFYRHIAMFSAIVLHNGGRLYFEINPLYADSIVSLLRDSGFVNVLKIDDLYGKTRFIKASKQ